MNRAANKSTFKRLATRTLTIALLLSTLFLSGCVYLRLLETKSQLASFKKYFTVVQSDETVVFEFNKPALKQKDLTLLDIFFSEKINEGDVERWQVTLEKRYTKGKQREHGKDLIAWLEFKDNKLISISMDAHYFDVFPIDFVEDTGIAMGKAKIRPVKQLVVAKWKNTTNYDPIAGISIEKLKLLFGEPYEEKTDDEFKTLTYRYLNRLPTDSGLATKYVIRFNFSIEDERLTLLATDSIRIHFNQKPRSR